MILAELAPGEAVGGVLAHALTLDGRRLAKGTAIDPALAERLRGAGIARLWVARAEAGDVPEALAAAAIGAALAGAGVEARPPVHGRVNLLARHDGLVVLDPQAVGAANAASADVGIATLAPDTPVRAGDLVATVKVIPFAMPQAACARVRGAGAVIGVRPWRDIGPAILLQTLLPDSPAKLRAKTAAITRDRLARFGWDMAEAGPVAHAIAPLADALGAARGGHGLILIAGATATADRRDVIPAAIEAAGGTVVRVGMPVDPGNLLVLGGWPAGPVVIGLPGCARSPKRNGLDLVLERIAAGLAVDSAAVAAMGVGGLLEGSGLALPWGWQG